MSSLPSARVSAEQAALFAADPRIHFSKVTGKWEYEDDDGNEMEYDPVKKTWVAVIDEDLVKSQQAAYAVPGVDEEEPAAPVLNRISKKRKEPDYTSKSEAPEGPGPSIKRGKTSHSSKPAKPLVSKNTAVYVTGLPLDATVEEIAARFSKCGVLMEDDDGDPKIKLYADENGNFNGHALVVYFQEDSVTLALNILDEAELRFGERNTVMSVKKAEYGHKNHPDGAPAPRVVDKKKASKRITKMKSKVQEWGFDDGFGPSAEDDVVQAPRGRVVVLKHMFTLEELQEDATLLLDLKEDVREECSTLGDVTNVVLYDKEPEGIMTVKFRDPLSAEACVLKMNGRFFAGRRISADYFNGRQRFKRTGVGEDADDEQGAEAEKKRLDAFAQWLLSEES